MPLSIMQVLRDVGVDIVDSDYPQQIQCPFHAAGDEMHKSARVYPDANNWHCFTESKSYSVLATIATYHDISFTAASDYLNEKYGIGSSERLVRNQESLDTRLADFLNCLSPDEVLSSNVDELIANVARGSTTDQIHKFIDDEVEKRWPHFARSSSRR